MVPFGQVPKVTIRLVVEAANVHEQKDQVWLADLTGNMMEEGTTSLTADALAREFAAMGGQLGIGVGPDRTSISTDVLADHGVRAVGLIADVAARPRFPESELARVKANMVRDLSIRKSTPQSAAEEKFSELMYGDHPYGRIFPTEAMLTGLHARPGEGLSPRALRSRPIAALYRRRLRRRGHGGKRPEGI